MSLILLLFDHFDIIHRTVEMPAKGQEISQIHHYTENIYRTCPVCMSKMFQAHSFNEIILSLISASASKCPTALCSKIFTNLKYPTKISKETNIGKSLFRCHYLSWTHPVLTWYKIQRLILAQPFWRRYKSKITWFKIIVSGDEHGNNCPLFNSPLSFPIFKNASKS